MPTPKIEKMIRNGEMHWRIRCTKCKQWEWTPAFNNSFRYYVCTVCTKPKSGENHDQRR